MWPLKLRLDLAGTDYIVEVGAPREAARFEAASNPTCHDVVVVDNAGLPIRRYIVWWSALSKKLWIHPKGNVSRPALDTAVDAALEKRGAFFQEVAR